MIKVLHVYKTCQPQTHGGVESFINSLCVKSNSEVSNTVFALSKKPSEFPIQYNGYEIHLSKQDLYFFSTGLSISAFSHFKKLIKQSDIIHYHFPNPMADLLHLMINVDKPAIITYHSDIIKYKILYFFYKPLMYLFLNNAKNIIFTSNNYLKSSSVAKRIKSEINVIPIGIDKNYAENVSMECKSFWEKKIRKPFFLFVGVLRDYKGLKYAVEAFNQIDSLFVIAGDGPQNKILQNIVDKKSIKNVIFLGKINEVDKKCLLDLCYAFIFPSHLRSEAFGISLLEASIFEKAMITCDISTGTSYVNKHNETGLVVKPASSSELKKAILYFLSNPEIVKTFGLNARKRVITNFCDELISQKYLDLYKRIVT